MTNFTQCCDLLSNGKVIHDSEEVRNFVENDIAIFTIKVYVLLLFLINLSRKIDSLEGRKKNNLELLLQTGSSLLSLDFVFPNLPRRTSVSS